MSWTLKGTLSGVGTDGSGTWDISSLGVASGDVIVLVIGSGQQNIDSAAPSITANVTGALTNVADLYENDTNDTNLYAYVTKATGADTSIAGQNIALIGWMVRVYSGADATTQLDVAVTTATGTNGSRPDPASITPTTTGAKIVGIYGAAQGTLSAWTAPANMSNFVQATASSKTRFAIADADWTGGAFDPDAVTGGTSSSSDSWAAVTIALRPAVTSQTLTPSLFTNSQSFFSPTAHATNTLTPGLLSNSQTFFVPTAAATKALTAPLLSNSQSFYPAEITQTQILTPALFDATYGDEQVVNGTFNTDASSWTDSNANLTLSVVSGRVRMTIADPSGGTKVGALSQAITVQPGRQYTATADIFIGTGSNALVRVGSAPGGLDYGNFGSGSSATFIPLNETVYVTLLTNGTTGQYGEFDNVSLKPRQLFVPSLSNKLSPPVTFSGNIYFIPIVHYGNTLQASLYTSSQSFFNPNVSRVLGPSVFTNTNSYHSATITPGPVSVLPTLSTNTQVFYTESVAFGVLAPPLLTNTQTFFGPVLHSSKTLTPTVFTNTGTFYSEALSSTITITASEIINTNTIYSPQVAGVAVHITITDILKNYSEFKTPEISFINPAGTDLMFRAGRRTKPSNNRRRIPLRTPYN